MKKLTIHFLTITLAITAFTVTAVYAQKRIVLKDGKAKVSANVKANGSVSYSISGKDFGKLNIRQTKGGKFKYEIRRGSEFLSSGHSTGFSTVNSDGRSTYKVIIINEENKNRSIELSFQKTGGGNDI